MNETTQTLLEVLDKSDFFTVSTERTVTMAEGSPWAKMVKRSTYHIVTGASLKKLVGRPRIDYGKYNVDIYGKFAWSRSTGREYILAGLDRSSGFGSSEYLPVSDLTGHVRDRKYRKRDIERYLPQGDDFGSTFFIGIDTVKTLEPKKTWLPGTELPNELPF
jgi:hypothetical protein